MNPYWDNGIVKLYHGDCRDVLREMPAESVHCVVTSPPYWGLRDYGLEPTVWGGEADCVHEWATETVRAELRKGVNLAQSHVSTRGGAKKIAEVPDIEIERGQCVRCEAWLGTLGLEPTPDLYVGHIVEVFREISRVLRRDGTVWLNMGDSYASNWPSPNRRNVIGNTEPSGKRAMRPSHMGNGLKDKDLAMMPARVALALQVDGWWVRSKIIWAKHNPMPESVDDRPTSAHEDVFFLTKSGAPLYWTHRDRAGTRKRPTPDWRWEHAAGREVVKEPERWRDSQIVCPTCRATLKVAVEARLDLFGDTWRDTVPCDKCDDQPERAGVTPERGHVWEWSRITLWRGHDYFYDAEAVREKTTGNAHARGNGVNPKAGVAPAGWDTGPGAHGSVHRRPRQNASFSAAVSKVVSARNMRDVWTIAPEPYPDAHFATFPQALVEPCILAGTPERGVCAECGAPWQRVIDRQTLAIRSGYQGKWLDADPQASGRRMLASTHAGRRAGLPHDNPFPPRTTKGWRPSCAHDADPIPAMILDPFAGAGTVGLVAQRLGRRGVLVDANREYLDMARRRIEAIPLPIGV